MDLGEEDTKLLEKARKVKEAQKKKEAADVSKTAWKDWTRQVSPYSQKAGGTTGFNYGSSGGMGGWALQQLLTQQLSAAKGDHGGKKAGGKSAAAAAAVSGGQDGAYAARMAAGRLQYPCNTCGQFGHWKKDRECNAKDVAAYIKRRMEQNRKDEVEDAEETGMKYIFFLALGFK